MPDFRDTRKKLTIAIVSLAVADVALVAVLFSPLIGSELSRHQRMDELWSELQIKTRTVAPLRGLDKKIPIAHQQVADFYQGRFTSQESVISESLGKLASQSGVKIGQIKYGLKDSNSPSKNRIDAESVGLERLLIEADFSGSYTQLARFINSLERSHLFFIVDSVELGGEQGGEVKLQIKLETYLRTGVA